MALSSRTLFIAGCLFALGSFSAGLVHCAQQDAAGAWQRLAAAAGAPAAAVAARPVPADARCPVCGMYPARFPHWAAQLHLRDGGIRFFDSPREFFTFLRDLPRYGKGVTADDIVAGYVTGFDKGGWIAVGNAWFVRGSAVAGPMRSDALPAFASREAATAFVAKHGGTLLAFADVDAALAAPAGDGSHHHH